MRVLHVTGSIHSVFNWVGHTLGLSSKKYLLDISINFETALKRLDSFSHFFKSDLGKLVWPNLLFPPLYIFVLPKK